MRPNPPARSVLITGCSSGIGYCSAKGLAARGYQVFASARKAEDVERLKNEGLNAIQLDLADSASIKSAVNHVLERCDGRLYGLFNNAAYGQPGAVEELRREVIRAQFETNLFGTMELTNLLIPAMRQQGEGRIIQNSSLLGFVALCYRGAYNASKYALEGLSDTLRLELAGSGVHVSLIEPGPISSRFRANSFAMYQHAIDKANSVHRPAYDAIETRLTKQGPAAPFTLPAEAVLAKVIHALESRQPKTRYRVTWPSHFFALMKRLISDRMLDKILLNISLKEQSK